MTQTAITPRAAVASERSWRLAPASRAERVGYAGVLIAGLLHGLLVAGVFFANRQPVVPLDAPEEIPVEIVTEPPQPPPPPPAQDQAAQPQPPASQDIDIPTAYDAPRAGNDKTAQSYSDDKPNVGPPPLKPALAEPQPPPAPTPAQETPQTDARDQTQATTPPVPLSTDIVANANGEAIPLAAKPPPQPPAPPPKPAKPPGVDLATLIPQADYTFAGGVKLDRMANGHAADGYGNELWGMIMPHVRFPPSVQASPDNLRGEIEFVLDGLGRVIQRRVSRPSGSTEFDNAALAALAEAGPFPPPPRGLPINMTFGYSSR